MPWVKRGRRSASFAPQFWPDRCCLRSRVGAKAPSRRASAAEAATASVPSKCAWTEWPTCRFAATRVTSRPRAACPQSGCACSVTSRCPAIPTTSASRVSMDAAGNTCSRTRLPTTAWRSSALKIIAMAWKVTPATSSGVAETTTVATGTAAGGTITGMAAAVGAATVAAISTPTAPGWRQRPVEQQLGSQLPEQHSQQGQVADRWGERFVQRQPEPETGGLLRDDGRQGNFNYHCTMNPSGNVADSNYNWTSGNFNPQPR